jgi:peptidoglycan hydrolase-like protein with peptidoglycan-binding domain
MRTLRALTATTAAAATLAVGPAMAAASPASAPSGPALAQDAEVTDAPLLRLGDRGQSVAAWQRQINLLAGTGLVVDGIYGTSTEQATMAFQSFFGLRVDGIVGENTRDVMRYLLSQALDYTALSDYELFEVNGYQSEGGYCFEAQAGSEWNVECGPIPPYPLSARSIVLDDFRGVLVGGAQPFVTSITVETDEGEVLPADITREVNGITDMVWTTPVPPEDVYAVRAYDGDGTEVRAIVLDDGDTVQVLERGDVGPAVASWQNKLNRLVDAGLAEDGVFGGRTVMVTMDLQGFFGLRVDGIVGPETRDLVDFLLGATGR